jgi:outer membrane lipoprotein-sorting protein
VKCGRLLPLAAVLSLSSPAAPLAQVLARMDEAAVGFRGLTAAVRQVSYTFVIKEMTEESGKITLLRPKPKDLRMLVEYSKPEQRAVAFANKKFQMYYPKLQVVREYDLGKQSSLLNEFLLLGFGTPGAELARSYHIKVTGEETLNGVRSDRLELVPKSEEARRHVSGIEIWVSQADGLTIQQKVNQPSRDYTLITYTDIRRNPSLQESDVRLNLPKGVKKETPQK